MTPINTSYPKVGPQKWDPMCHKLRPHLGSWRTGSAHYDVGVYFLLLLNMCVHVYAKNIFNVMCNCAHSLGANVCI